MVIKFLYNGGSTIIDPLGEIIYQKNNEEDIFTYTLEKEKVTETRNHFPFWKDARFFNYRIKLISSKQTKTMFLILREYIYKCLFCSRLLLVQPYCFHKRNQFGNSPILFYNNLCGLSIFCMRTVRKAFLLSKFPGSLFLSKVLQMQAI